MQRNHHQRYLAQNNLIFDPQDNHHIRKFHHLQLHLDHSYLHKDLYSHLNIHYTDHLQLNQLNLDRYRLSNRHPMFHNRKYQCSHSHLDSSHQGHNHILEYYLLHHNIHLLTINHYLLHLHTRNQHNLQQYQHMNHLNM